MSRRLMLSLVILIVTAIPALASPIYGAGNYGVSGKLDNQSLNGTIVWNGYEVTGYSLNFAGHSFTCSSNWGFCALFYQNIKVPGGNELLSGFLSPNFSPFTLSVDQWGKDPFYSTKLGWSSVAAPEESSLVQAGCLLAIFALAIPLAGRLRTQKA